MEKELRIEIKENGSDAFYRETANVAAQVRALLKKPDGKLKDYFSVVRNYLILCAVMFVLLGIMAAAWGADKLTAVAMALLAFTTLFEGLFLSNLHKMSKGLKNGFRPSVLTLDENGVELAKENSQTVRLDWGNIALIREFGESICFIPHESMGIMISVAKRYAKDITDWIKENRPEIKLH